MWTLPNKIAEGQQPWCFSGILASSLMNCVVWKLQSKSKQLGLQKEGFEEKDNLFKVTEVSDSVSAGF